MATPTPAAGPPRAAELASAAGLLAAGLLPRLWFVTAFATLPISDFGAVLELALAFRDTSLAPPGYWWDVLNVGPSFALSLALRLFPADPETTARLATAVWTGLTPLVPFALWRGALPLWARTLAGALLALWPGQVFFAGVVAQDNWALPPAVAVGALAARALVLRQAYPVAAALLFAAAVAMRQEMLYVLAPCALAGAGLLGRRLKPRAALAFACALTVPLLLLALQRRAATGELALSSGHVGYTLLGTVAPGATRLDWIDPVSFAASVAPELAADRHRLIEGALPLAVAELRRRPLFHAARTAAVAMRLPFGSDVSNLYWSLTAPGVLPEPVRARGEALASRLGIPLRRQSWLIQALFVAALLLGAWRRSWPLLALASAPLLKIALHAFLVAGSRFLVPATGLQLLVVAFAAWEATQGPRRDAWVALVAGLAGAAALTAAGGQLSRAVQARDVDEQRTYRFVLRDSGGAASLACTVATGRLTSLGAEEATLELPGADARPGERAVAACELVAGDRAGGAAQVALEVADGYAPGGLAGRIAQRVTVGDAPPWQHDVGDAPGAGWNRVPLAVDEAGRATVTVEVAALQPEPGVGWAGAAVTRFRLTTAGGPPPP
jgi:hypothetical protein